MFGAFGDSGFDDKHCFDRYDRLAPYGLKENDGEMFEEDLVDWYAVDWGTLQAQCVEENTDLFAPGNNRTKVVGLELPPEKMRREQGQTQNESPHSHSTKEVPRQYTSRKAVLIRTTESQIYNSEVMQHLRSMIEELSLQTGGEYMVYLLVEVTDDGHDIFDMTRQHLIIRSVPREFREIAILFNRELLKAWYPKVKSVGGQSLHSNQPIQLFSLQNPQFSHVWEVALETRYTGNWYNLLSNSMEWARQQPRRLQWERAEKFYIPSHHGSYANFSETIAAEYPNGGIWGPLSNMAIRNPVGPEPPTITPQEDDFEWGIGDDADDIVPSVLLKTKGTSIFSHNKVKGLTDDATRRALMVSPVKCMSKTLLGAMHDAQLNGIDMRPELFAHTMALVHGLKVAALPLPMFFENTTTTSADVDRMFNDPKKDFFLDNNKWTLPIKANTTFWWPLQFEQYPQQLYRRWYGVDQEGQQLDERQTGRLCLPGMLLYPVKDIGIKTEDFN